MACLVRAILGALVGGVGGLFLGAFLPLLVYYAVYMAPQGVPFRNMDQVGILSLYGGPVGAVVGALTGILIFRRRFTRTAFAMILACIGLVVIWLTLGKGGR